MTSGKEFDNWRKSQRSNGSGACVEAASGAGTVAIRDTTNRDGGALSFSAIAWAAFMGGLKTA
jgi:hypothetical protein